jgi:AraC-like DNA-binding protein
LAKIAVDGDDTGRGPIARLLARGEGWAVSDVVCTAGPQDRAFEERHDDVAVAIVVAGTFQYRSSTGRELMTPGSLLLGNPGEPFECGHEHAPGDRCLSFSFTPGYFESVAAEAGASAARPGFRVPRVPPLRALSRLVSQACAGLAGGVDLDWEEVGLRLATGAVQLAVGLSVEADGAPPGALARVTRIVRRIEHEADAPLTLRVLAHEAGLSPYHFLRTFERSTGLTPHQYLRRARLRRAASRLLREPGRIVDVAFDCGFGDLSNFNRSFRAEFGVSPRRYRAEGGGSGPRASATERRNSAGSMAG